MDFEFDTTRRAIPQGDCYLVPIKAIPAGATPVEPENGHLIITHSETGHHHVIAARPDIRTTVIATDCSLLRTPVTA
jgi:hypothetical protein